jgi:hypothetical protein
MMNNEHVHLRFFFCLRVVHLVYAYQRQYNQDSLVIIWEVMGCLQDGL